MEKFLTLFQVISAILLIVLILFQKQSGEMSSLFGGGSSGEGYRTKRGMEKWLFWGTVILAVLFILSAILRIVL